MLKDMHRVERPQCTGDEISFAVEIIERPLDNSFTVHLLDLLDFTLFMCMRWPYHTDIAMRSFTSLRKVHIQILNILRSHTPCKDGNEAEASR
jgi:hypothetical protein